MRVKLLTQRPLGEKIRQYLIEQGEDLVEESPDMIVIAYYPRILKKEEFENIPTINLHPGLLPHNRGMYPHIWPLVDGSPVGVTIHYVNENIDAGDIIAQKELPVYPTDIASDMEVRTQTEMVELFKLTWPKIKDGTAERRQQPPDGSYHHSADIKSIQEFDRDTIRRLRACTFEDRSYGYFVEDGKKIYVGVKFFTEDNIKEFERSQEQYLKKRKCAVFTIVMNDMVMLNLWVNYYKRYFDRLHIICNGTKESYYPVIDKYNTDKVMVTKQIVENMAVTSEATVAIV